jgi:hypothetical protein
MSSQTQILGALVSAYTNFLLSKYALAINPTTPPPPRLSQLPNELLLDIFDHIDWHICPPALHASLCRSKPLKNLSCVNHHFRHLLTPRLFHTLTNHSQRHYQVLEIPHEQRLAQATTNNPQLDLSHLSTALFLTPQIHAIRTVDLLIQPRPNEGRQLYHIFARFLPCLPNLQALRIRMDAAQLEALLCAWRSNNAGLPALISVEELDVQCHAAVLLKLCPDAHTLHITFTKEQIHCANTGSREYVSHKQHRFPASEKVTKLHCRGDWFDALEELAKAYPHVRHLVEHTDMLWSDCQRVAMFSAIGDRFAYVEYWEEIWGDGSVLKYMHKLERDGETKPSVAKWKRPICYTPE